MKISDNKSIIMFYGIHEEFHKQITTLFNFTLQDLDKGLKYLGYFLKHNDYRVDDRKWLIQNIEKRISNRCFRWLSLGGKLILVKSISEGMYVYSLSLAHIPSSILQIFKRRVFSFLSSSEKPKDGFHLVKWDLMARPKKLGGCGLKNISLFGKTPTSKGLWRGLFVKSYGVLSLRINI